MSSAMELNQDALEQIGEYVKQHLPEWQRETSAAQETAVGLSPEIVRREIDLGERIVRVEEELKTQRDLIREGFTGMNKRFEEQTASINARFDDVNMRFEDVNKRLEGQLSHFEKRFEKQLSYLNTRFEDVNRRFEEQTATLNKRFEEQTAHFENRFEEQLSYFNTRFGDVNRRFEEQTATSNKRFEEQIASTNARFDDVNKRFEDMRTYTNRWMLLISLFLGMIGAMPWIMGAY